MEGTNGITELFYCETYNDGDQIVKPHLKPRGRHVKGPFPSYGSAFQHGTETPCSHFSVTKAYTMRVAHEIPWVQ